MSLGLIINEVKIKCTIAGMQIRKITQISSATLFRKEKKITYLGYVMNENVDRSTEIKCIKRKLNH